jgi:hypothetical protein
MAQDKAKLLIPDEQLEPEAAPSGTPRWIRAGAILGGVALATGMFASVAFADDGGHDGGDHHGKHHGDGDDHAVVNAGAGTTVAAREAEHVTAPTQVAPTAPTKVTPPTNVTVTAPTGVGLGAQFNGLSTTQLTSLLNALGVNTTGLNLNQVSLGQVVDLAHDRGCSAADVSMILSGLMASTPALPAPSTLSATCSLIRP